MVGAVQLGVLAACVVLFVPMAMAGWHLSRNKMLFFSGALFITLAVCVHLTPYFPLLFVVNNDIINSKNNNNPHDYNDLQQSCIGLLHNVQFNIKSVEKNSNSDNEKSSSLEKTGSLSGEKSSSLEKIGSWGWINSENVISCGFQKLGRPDTSDLLNGSWVVIAGDSQARLFSVSLLGLILKKDEMSSVKGDLFKRHSDYQIEISEIGMKLDFIWAPYVDDINNLVTGYRENGTYPDVFVMGAGLWHMLHMANPSSYGFSVRKLKKSLVSFKSPHVFWLGMPTLVNSMLNTEEKREKMSDLALESYNQEIYESELLKKNGGPLLMIDVEMLSQRCGRKCTEDGMHYDGIVYEAAVHVLLNALLIESHQKL